MSKKEGTTFTDDFKTPLTAPKPGPEPGPGVYNIPLMDPGDPLGYVPGGHSTGKLSGGKK